MKNGRNDVFPKRLEEIRKNRKLTQTELAKAIGSHVNVIWQYENARRIPTLENANKIANILNVDLNYLMGNEENVEIVEFDSVTLLSSIRKYFSNEYIKQAEKDIFYKNISNAYWKGKK